MHLISLLLMEMHLFNQLITDHLLYIPVKINKVLYQKSILNFLTFNTLSILFINNIIDIINILYKRGFNSVALHIGVRGRMASVCRMFFFYIRKMYSFLLYMLYTTYNYLIIKQLHQYNRNNLLYHEI